MNIITKASDKQQKLLFIQLAERYNLPADVIESICKSPYKTLFYVLWSKSGECVRWQYFGVFRSNRKSIFNINLHD